MLKFFRDKKDSWFVKGVLILTALSFMSLFGIQGVSSFSESNQALATVGKTKITVYEYTVAFDRAVSRLRASAPVEFSLKDALDAGMVQQVLDGIISEKVSEKTADVSGIGISDSDLYDFIVTDPMFAGYDGAFSRDAFNEHLKKIRQSEKEYVERLRNSARAMRLFGAVQSMGIAPKAQAETMYRLANEKRAADVFFIRAEDVKIPAKPTQKQLQELYEAESDSLIAPEYRSLSVIKLTPEIAAKNVKVSDDFLKDLYEQNKQDFVVEETRQVNQMLFETQADADKAMAALKSGKSFMQVAKTIANQTEEQTSLGEVVRNGLLTELSDPVFEAKKGAVVGPVKTAFGWQILKVEKITPRKETSFEKAKATLEKNYRTARAYDDLEEILIRIEDAFGAGQSMEEVAGQNGLTVKKYAFTDMGGLDEDGKKTGLDMEVLNAAFLNEVGQVSPMIETSEGYFAVRVDKVKDPQLKSFDRAKKELTALWEKNTRAQTAEKTARKVYDLLSKGVSAAKTAKQTGVKLQKMKDVTRQSADVASSVSTVLFAKNKGDVFQTQANGAFVVGKVVRITPASAQDDVVGVFEMQQRMAKAAGAANARTLLSAYAAYLDTRVNSDVLDKVKEHLRTQAERDSDDEY